jgi:hypothetical protein
MELKKLSWGVTCILFLFFFLSNLHSATLKVKVIVDDASIKATPEIVGEILDIVSVETILEAERKQGEWYKVYFEKDGQKISGFIHELFVEVLKEEKLDKKKVGIQPKTSQPSLGKPVLALINLSRQNISEEETIIITSFIQEELFFVKEYELIERTQVEEVLRQYQDEGGCDLKCAVSVGKHLNADKVIMGTVGRLGDFFTVQIKMMDIETGKISNMSSIRAKCQIGELPNYMGDLVGKIIEPSLKAEAEAQELPKEEVQKPPAEEKTEPVRDEPKKQEITEQEIKEGTLVPVQSVDVVPVVVKTVAPEYEWKRTFWIYDKLIVNILISENGDVENAAVLGGTKINQDVKDAVEKAVMQWKFKPALKNGVKVKVWKPVVVRIKR